MAAATLTLATLGRGPTVFGNLSGIYVTVTATATVYATASGGLPIDLTGILQQATPPGDIAPNYTQALNPADIVGIMPVAMSTNKFLALGFTLGTPTYTAVPWMTSTNETGVPGILATCPCTIRLYATGASNAAAFAEIADGAVTDAVTFVLLVARNGANN